VVRIPAEVKDFSHFQGIQTVLGPTQAHIEWVPLVFPHEYGSRGEKLATFRHVILRLRCAFKWTFRSVDIVAPESQIRAAAMLLLVIAIY
jgi:hypothetical protein